jgi:hypothetical protein
MEIHYAFLIREIDSAIADLEADTKIKLPVVGANIKGQLTAHKYDRSWLMRCWNSVCAEPDGVTVHRFNEDDICLKCGMPRDMQ